MKKLPKTLSYLLPANVPELVTVASLMLLIKLVMLVDHEGKASIWLTSSIFLPVMAISTAAFWRGLKAGQKGKYER